MNPSGMDGAGQRYGGPPAIPGQPQQQQPQYYSQQQQQQQMMQQQQQQQYAQYHPPSPQRLSSQGSTGSGTSNNNNNGPRAKCDQVVFEAIAKAAEIIVASRCWIDSDPALQTTGSGRFSLLVPEVKSVRSILQRWKRSMHIPLRLDVFYQHPPPEGSDTGGDRELLERWCLEYAPTTHGQQQPPYEQLYPSVDPIVQLRRVCKAIVVWLRTLYCHSRLLPAQALRKTSTTSNIGFSIYVVGAGQDDIHPLLAQGFDSEPKPSAASGNGGISHDGVPTPYGTVAWKVYLAPREQVRRLLQIEREKERLLQQQQYMNATNAPPRSIPMKILGSNAPPSPQQQYELQPPKQPIARSAPTHTHRSYRRSNSDSVAQHHTPELQTRYYSKSPSGQASAIPRSYHPQSSDLANRYHAQTTGHSPGRSLVRRNTFDPSTVPQESTTTPTTLTPLASTPDSPASGASGDSKGGGIKKNKNPSALSLALMSLKDEESSSSTSPTTEAAADEEQRLASERRRAALHHAPPAMTGVGEYGYGYNNLHLPATAANAATHALSSSPALFRGGSTPGTASTLGTTPPGYLLGATPTVGSHVSSAGLIPPARPGSSSSPVLGSQAVAPPFVRPLGFAGQAPASGMASEAAAATIPTQQHPPTSSTPPATSATAPQQDDHKPSLDLLHSSPFHHSVMGGGPTGGSSYHALSSTTKDGLASFLQEDETKSMEAATTFINEFYHHHYPMASMMQQQPHGGHGGDFHHHHHHLSQHHHHGLSSEAESHHHHSFFGDSGAAASAAYFEDTDAFLADDMPFAVEGIAASAATVPAHTMGSTSLHPKQIESSLLAASMGMIPQKKLALFGNNSNEADEASHPAASSANTTSDPNDTVDALADQLADFRSFGASLSSPPLTTSVGSGG